ncbi:ferredoxin family protein [bacterium]|nr:ferredoxin family protein [bacterium]
MRIDPEKCTACAQCPDYCPVTCIHEGDGVYFMDEDECVECGVCLRDAGCPTEAIYMPEESNRYPRSIRAAFSDPAVQYPEELFPDLKQGGRGTEEMKTNDVTGNFPRGEFGMTLEFGRPGTGTRLREVEKVTTLLTSLGIRFEGSNALFFLLEEPERGVLKRELRDEKVLSIIVEFTLAEAQLETIVAALFEVLQTVDTVVSWGLVTRFEEDGSLPVTDRLEKLGLTVRPNAKVNMGMGRPIIED